MPKQGETFQQVVNLEATSLVKTMELLMSELICPNVLQSRRMARGNLATSSMDSQHQFHQDTCIWPASSVLAKQRKSIALIVCGEGDTEAELRFTPCLTF